MDSSCPAPLSVGGGGISAAAGTGSRALALRASNAPRAAGGDEASGGGVSRMRTRALPGGTSAAPTGGGAVPAPTARGDAPEQRVKRGAARELWGSAFDVLAGDGGVGRGRFVFSPGSVSSGDRYLRDRKML